jgi:hypothetical protein
MADQRSNLLTPSDIPDLKVHVSDWLITIYPQRILPCTQNRHNLQREVYQKRM